MSTTGTSKLGARHLVVLVPTAVALTVLVAVVGLGAATSDGVVRAGWPTVWVVQDQSALSPPPGIAAPARLLTPWEYPTQVHGGRFVVDVVLAAGVLLLVVGAVTHRRAPGRPGSAGRDQRMIGIPPSVRS